MKLYKIPLVVLGCAALGWVTAFRPAGQSAPDVHPYATTTDSTRGLDPTTGFVIAEGIELMRAHCTGCHSSRMITQYRASREVWLEKIRWMQRTQNLWDLGEAEPKILDYLAKHYAPTAAYDRRKPLEKVEWYRLDTSAPRH
jgi:hypothetical protein